MIHGRFLPMLFSAQLDGTVNMWLRAGGAAAGGQGGVNAPMLVEVGCSRSTMPGLCSLSTGRWQCRAAPAYPMLRRAGSLFAFRTRLRSAENGAKHDRGETGPARREREA